MKLQNKLLLLYGLPVIIFIITLYSLWSIEFIRVITYDSKFPQVFRDLHSLGLPFKFFQHIILITFLLSPCFFFIGLFPFLYFKFKKKVKFNKIITVIVIACYLLYFILIFYERSTNFFTTNPLTALLWFFD